MGSEVQLSRNAKKRPVKLKKKHYKSEYRIMNGYQDRINRKGVYFKVVRAKRFHPSTFDIRYSIFCGSLFSPASKAARLIIKKPRHFGEVSYERSRWPDT